MMQYPYEKKETLEYLMKFGFKPLKIADFKKYPKIKTKVSRFITQFESWTGVTADELRGMGIVFFGGVVRDLVSGITAKGSDIDLLTAHYLREDSKIEKFSQQKNCVKTECYIKRQTELLDIRVALGVRSDRSYDDIRFSNSIDEGALYESEWGAVFMPVSFEFENNAAPPPVYDFKNKDFLEDFTPRPTKIIQLLRSKPVDFWFDRGVGLGRRLGPLFEYDVDDIENTILPARLVDFVCCGLVMMPDGEILETVPGAFEDALNGVLRVNNDPKVSFRNTNKRSEKLQARGWKISADPRFR